MAREKKMPAPNELVWYKWFPVKALTSTRWTLLSMEEQGFYRFLYDLAAIAQPSNRRGWLYEHDQPLSSHSIGKMSRLHGNKARNLLRKLKEKGLMSQDENGAWGFPNFAKHQRRSRLRPRSRASEKPTDGTELGQKWDKKGPPEADAEADADIGVKKKEIIPPNGGIIEKENGCAPVTKDEVRLINEWTVKFPRSRWSTRLKYDALRQHFTEAFARGATVEALLAEMQRAVDARNLAPKPWEITGAADTACRERMERQRDKARAAEHERRLGLPAEPP